MKNYSDPVENRTRDLQVCSAVSQPNAPPRGPNKTMHYLEYNIGLRALCFSCPEISIRTNGQATTSFDLLYYDNFIR